MRTVAGLLRRFGADERGAVTIDWVAVTSAILLLGIAVVYSVFNLGVDSLVGNINATLDQSGTDVAASYMTDSTAADSGTLVATGNASQQACARTLRFVVCIGNK